MKAQLESFATSRNDVRLRTIDVRSWDSPVSKQHGIRSLPHLVLYRGDECVATGMKAVVPRLTDL